jgi:energy-coupling factor transporter ATP-binding protein EcfA2
MSEPVIELRGLQHHYETDQVLRYVDLRIEQGEIFDSLGHNGVGKTTPRNILTTLLTPTGLEAPDEHRRALAVDSVGEESAQQRLLQRQPPLVEARGVVSGSPTPAARGPVRLPHSSWLPPSRRTQSVVFGARLPAVQRRTTTARDHSGVLTAGPASSCLLD